MRPPRRLRRGIGPGLPPGPGRRVVRRAARRLAWNPPPPELDAARSDVARAHELMAAGDYHTAAELFTRVAALAAGHQRFRHAGHLYLQAVRAALEAGNLTLAMAHADRAIDAFMREGNFPLAVQVISRLEEELRARGYRAEAQTLHDKLDERLREAGMDPGELRASVSASGAARRDLPAQCPACLGPVRSDEVEWIDATSAVCSYCGTVLKAN